MKLCLCPGHELSQACQCLDAAEWRSSVPQPDKRRAGMPSSPHAPATSSDSALTQTFWHLQRCTPPSLGPGQPHLSQLQCQRPAAKRRHGDCYATPCSAHALQDPVQLLAKCPRLTHRDSTAHPSRHTQFTAEPAQQQPQARLLCQLSPISLALGTWAAQAPPPPPRLVSMPSYATTHMPLPRPLPFDIFEFMAAAMRLLGHKERSTLQLALHCWHRVEDQVQLWSTPVVTAPELQRGAALVVLWVAAKCEEEREHVGKASLAATLLPPGLAVMGAEAVQVMELKVMGLLDWSPYRGFQMG